MDIDKQFFTKYGFVFKDRVDLSTTDTSNLELTKLQKVILSTRLTNEDLMAGNIKDFFYNYLDLTHNIERLPDGDCAACLLEEHIRTGKHIVGVTDYDADGVNSAVVIYRIFKDIFKLDDKHFDVLVNRRRAGNGFNNELMGRIISLHKKHPIDLIITADHGSNDNNQFKILKDLGIKLIVTDHHKIDDNKYPTNADCFINNQRDDSEYSKNMSGCFMVFITLVNTYRKMYNTNDLSVFNKILPYVAISTITDVMSLKTALNRHLIKTGLNELNAFKNIAWAGIKKVLDIPGKITFKDVGYKLGPLINTANRVDNEELAYSMLIADNFANGNEVAIELARLNTFRKEITKSVVTKANTQILDSKYKYSIVITVETDIAINGVVAAQLGSSQMLPTVCFINNNDDRTTLVGSGRSIIPGVDIFKIYNDINAADRGIFLKYGGHKEAGGCSIHADKFEAFRDLFDKFAKEQILALGIDHRIQVDAFIPDYLITPMLAKGVESCGPYGKEWPEPVFLTKLTVNRVFLRGPVGIITFSRRNNTTLEATYFLKNSDPINKTNIKDILTYGTEVYLAFNIQLNSFQQRFSLMINVVDIKLVENK